MPTTPPSRPTRPLRDGPLTLPGWLDGLSERWWRLGPRPRAAVTVVLALLVLGAGVARATAPIHGPSVEVVATIRALPAGTDLATTDGVRLVAWPRDLLPREPLTEATGVLRGPLPAGTVVASASVGDGGLGALAGPGRAAVPLPVGALPPVAVGDRLRVVATSVDGGARPLADDVDVLVVDDEAVWLAVAIDAAGEVAAAGVHGSLAAVVLPP